MILSFVKPLNELLMMNVETMEMDSYSIENPKSAVAIRQVFNFQYLKVITKEM